MLNLSFTHQANNLSFHGYDEDLACAKKVVSDIKRMGLKSNTDLIFRYKNREQAVLDGEKQSENFLPVIKDKIKVYGKKIRQLRDQYIRKAFGSYEDFKREFIPLLEKFKVANCYEYALLTCLKLRDCGKQPLFTQILVMNTETGVVDLDRCHNTVVMGISEDADFNDPSTWGPEAIIVDPWIGVARSVPKAFNLFKEKISFNKETEKLIISQVDLDKVINIVA